jgi:hypothetical protein
MNGFTSIQYAGLSKAVCVAPLEIVGMGAATATDAEKK